ncbi:conjugal transfer protein TraN [Pseudomonas fluorescens]|uniref:conjugal transfer protein TraN n=1 Tax=Pseudomonas fluorescens TaxID=294 RepID=UPI0010DA9AE0|nr:conjugal transfer protein TraN [Pseudomonas fluorescens]TCV62826.1 conjugal transfer mating pair stabilization protein TraN [Pseudomonas fluorescens]
MRSLSRITAAVTLFFYGYAICVPAWADSISSSAADGNKAAQDAMNSWSAPTASSSEITFGSGGQKQTINLSELFPGVSDTSGSGDLKNLYGNDEGTLSAGSSANTSLLSENSMSGDAYRLLKDTSSTKRPDLKNDPLWTNTDKTIDNQDIFNKDFADCKQTTETTKTTTSKHVSDMKTCERVADKSGVYTLKHDYTAGVVKYVDGPTNFQSCGPGCIDIWLGQVGDNYWSGYCAIYENNMTFEVINPDAIQSASLTYAKWDDYMQVWVANTKVWSGPNENFPPETAGACELGTSWSTAPNVDMTSLLKVKGAKEFKIRASVAGKGEAYAKLRVLYDPLKAVSEEKWYSQEAVDVASSINDGYCQGSFVCTKMPAISDTGCAEIDGVTVCESSFGKGPPLPGISPLCQEVSINSQCNFYKGDMECYTDAQGQQQCPVNTDRTCSVNHNIKVMEIPFAAKIAVEDAPGTGETNRVVVDFSGGSFQNTTSTLRSDASIDQANFDYLCKSKGEDGRALPQKIAVSSIGLWTGHKYAPKTLGVDATNIVQLPSCENGLKMIVDIKDTGSGTTGWFYAHEFRFKAVRIAAESYGPKFCIDAANKVQSGQCSEGGAVQVTKGVASGCLPLNGISVCPGDSMYAAMLPSPVQGVDKLFQAAKVTGCVNGGMNLNTCAKFEADKTCGFISQKCVDGAKGDSGQCYVTEEVWDCGYDVQVPSTDTKTSYQCAGPVRCLGKECFNPTDEKSTEFGYAAAALQIAQFAEHDLDCGENPEDTTSDHVCKVFKGEMMECKKAVGGWVDCCEAPDGVSLMDYITLTYNTIQLTEKVGIIDNAPTLSSAWTLGKELASGSGWDSAWSAASATNAAVTDVAQLGVIEGFKQQMMNYVANWTANTFGPAAANAVFASGIAANGPSTEAFAATNPTTGAVTTAPNATLASSFAAVLSVVMIAYMIYQIANILVNIIWECEPKEFELGAKKETKVCHYVGSYCASKTPFGCIEKRESYCCFNSPLGRIIQEQGRPQLGMTWGDAENPSCEALGVDQIAKLDWSKIDISEWIGLLQVTNFYPTADKINLDNLTGKGSALNIGEGRTDTLNRNTERLDGLNESFSETRKAAEDNLRDTFNK